MDFKNGPWTSNRSWSSKTGLEVQTGIGPGGGWHGEHEALHQHAWTGLLLKPNICHQWASPRLPHHHSLGLVSQLKPKPKTSSPSPLASPPAYQPHRELPPPAARRREELWRRSGGVQKMLPPWRPVQVTMTLILMGIGQD